MALEDMVKSSDLTLSHALKDFEQWGDKIRLYHETSSVVIGRIKSSDY